MGTAAKIVLMERIQLLPQPCALPVRLEQKRSPISVLCVWLGNIRWERDAVLVCCVIVWHILLELVSRRALHVNLENMEPIMASPPALYVFLVHMHQKQQQVIVNIA